MMSFKEFCEDCPKRRANEETGTAHCEGPGRCLCEVGECTSYHVYRKIMRTVEKLKNHCHYHIKNDGRTMPVTFEEED